MTYAVTTQTLRSDNWVFADSGGISQNNRSKDFHPGFYDCESRQIVISRFADGLPRHWVTERDAAGRVRIPSGRPGSYTIGFTQPISHLERDTVCINYDTKKHH